MERENSAACNKIIAESDYGRPSSALMINLRSDNESKVFPEIIEYLKTPPDIKQFKKILLMLNKKPRDIIRKGEKEYKTLKLDDESLDSESLIKSMVENPILIERPIVVSGNEARLGRPPELVLELL